MLQTRTQVLGDQGWREPCSHPLTTHWEKGPSKPMQDPFPPMLLQLVARAALTGPDSFGHVPGQTVVCCPCRGKSRPPYLQLPQDMKAAALCVLLVCHEGRNFVLRKHKHRERVLAECPPDVSDRGWGPSLRPGSSDMPLDPSSDHCAQARRVGDDPTALLTQASPPR